MASQYDREARALERRRQIAEALRASGNEPLPASIESGRIHAQVSPWAHLAKALNPYLATRAERAVDQEETALAERQRKAQAEWMRGLTEAQAPSELQPIAPTGKLLMTDNAPISNLELDPNAPADKAAPVGLQDQLARRMKGQALFGDVKRQVDAGDRQKMLSHYMKGGDIGGLAGAIGAAGLERELLPPVKDDFTLGMGETRVDAKTGKVIAQGMPKPAEDERTDDIKEYERAVADGYKGSFSDYMLMMKKAGASNQSVHLPPEQSEYDKTVGKGFGEMYLATQDAEAAADVQLGNLARAAQLLEGYNTGALTPALTEVSSVMASLGWELDDKLDEKQAADSLSKRMALELRNPSLGAGMPGAMSDQDRKYLESMVAGLGKTPGANKLIIETATKFAQRKKDIARLAREYAAQHGRLDAGFNKVVSDFANANPLFTGLSGPRVLPTDKPAPKGVDQNIWNIMTPEERALWPTN